MVDQVLQVVEGLLAGVGYFACAAQQLTIFQNDVVVRLERAV
jgi:hypothetical protein